MLKMKVTIIIPVFNAEKHLEKCVNSVLTQNHCDFEVLLINDGSIDNSDTICDEFARKDERIKVFHQVNAGVSAARNKGIENAHGEWLTFIDSDDYIQKDYFKVLDFQNKTDWIHLDMEREVFYATGLGMNFENKEYNLSEFVNTYSLYPNFPEACAKFFKNSIIKMNNLKFNMDLKFGEDSLFNLKYLKFCNFISTTNVSKYVYKNGEGGLSKLTYDIKNDTTLFREVEKELELYPYPNKFFHQTIKTPLIRYLKILYYDNSISSTERRLLLKKYVEKYYQVCLAIYTKPKIRLFFVLAHLTGFYSILDFVLVKLNKK